MAGVVEQADRRSGRRHQPVDLLVGLDDRPHMVVEGHADAEIGHALGERRQPPPVAAPIRRPASFGRFEIGAKRSPSDRPDVSA